MPETDTRLPDADDAADEIFLSPRVIDMKSFQDLEARLRRLIAHALESGKALVSLDEKAGASLAALAEATPEIADRQRDAERVLASLDERVGTAEAMLEAALARAERASSFEADIEATIEAAGARLEARLATSVADAEQRLRAIEARAAEGATRFRAELDAAVAEAMAKARSQADEARAGLREARAEADRASADLRTRLDDLRDEATSLRVPMLELLNELCERAGALLGRDPRALDQPGEPARGSMGDVVGRAERLLDQTRAAIGDLETVRTRTDDARRLLGDSLRDSASTMDALAARHRDLRRELRETGEACDRAKASVAQRTDEIRRVLEQPLADARAEIARLAELADRAARAGRAADDAADRHERTLARVDEALERLEPWRGPLLEGKAGLPEPLRRVVDEFRLEIADDIGRIAEGLQSIAGRAADARDRARERDA